MICWSTTACALEYRQRSYPCTQFHFFSSWLAKEKGEMKRLGVTHVVNTAQGKKFSQINTDAEYYADIGVQYYGIEGAMDMAGYKINGHFRPAASFIKEALDGGGMCCFYGSDLICVGSCSKLAQFNDSIHPNISISKHSNSSASFI